MTDFSVDSSKIPFLLHTNLEVDEWVIGIDYDFKARGEPLLELGSSGRDYREALDE